MEILTLSPPSTRESTDEPGRRDPPAPLALKPLDSGCVWAKGVSWQKFVPFHVVTHLQSLLFRSVEVDLRVMIWNVWHGKCFICIRKIQTSLRAGRERVTPAATHKSTWLGPRRLRVLKFPVVWSEGKFCSGNPVNRHENFLHGLNQAENPTCS